MNVTHASARPLHAAEPEAIAAAVLEFDRRVLLVGPPGSGKSTLVDALALTLVRSGRGCWCLSADPGSPRFGVPGAVCLGRWEGEGWAVEAVEALCSLDAGRFRLPLVAAVTRLARRSPPGTLLIDGPGVVRGVAGAELLPGLVAAAGAERVLALIRRDAGALPVVGRVALPVEVVAVQADAAAARPGKRTRARHRTMLWDAYLSDSVERRVRLATLALTGTPPPLQTPTIWVGRQIALLADGRTLAMGEVTAADADALTLRLPPGTAMTDTLLVRDAARLAGGHLETCTPFAADVIGHAPSVSGVVVGDAGPRVVGRVGMLDIDLVNGVFGDPLLHARLRHARRSLLFDLGEGARLPARIAHQVSDVFVSHCHFDHIAGFLWLLRSRIGEFPACRLFGPPGLAVRVDGFAHGVLWDRIEGRGPRFEVGELHGDRLLRYAVQAGHPGPVELDARPAADGVLLAESGFRVRAVTLDHDTPVLAFAFEPVPQLNVRKDRLRARGLVPGPWLGALKRNLLEGALDTPVELPDGRCETTAALAADLILISPGKRLVYATDFSDTAANRERLIALARGAHTLFCEATFLQVDAWRAERNAHLTTRACGEIGDAAGVARLVPFHFSRRYEHDPARVYADVAAVCGRTVVPRALARDEL